jgi:ABC-type phosphate/phosphonate transport system substrate-binding protein
MMSCSTGLRIDREGVLHSLSKIREEKKMKKNIVLLFSIIAVLCMTVAASGAESLTCWFPPGWSAKADQARNIAKALGDGSGLDIRPRIAKSYPEILTAFASDEENLVYVGSFVQAIIKARNIGTPLVQSINGKELYAGILVYPKGEDPEAILRNDGAQIAFAVGASSGESAAKAATGGKAAIGVANHGAASAAVVAGKAKGAVVKNWWWEANQAKFPTLVSYEIPNVSLRKNPDNVLTASPAVGPASREKITAAAIAAKDLFGATEMAPFDSSKLDFSLELMKKGNIDPMTYTW